MTERCNCDFFHIGMFIYSESDERKISEFYSYLLIQMNRKDQMKIYKPTEKEYCWTLREINIQETKKNHTDMK